MEKNASGEASASQQKWLPSSSIFYGMGSTTVLDQIWLSLSPLSSKPNSG
jgi:hypothetical protein